MLRLNTQAISCVDQVINEHAVLSSVDKIRKKTFNYFLRIRNEAFWHQHHLIANEDFHHNIIQAVNTATPLAVGRLGSVEASILMWSEGVAPCWPMFNRFSDTSLGATNAGIRPRNKESYRMFAKLCREALDLLDLQGVWMTGYEAICHDIKAQRKFFNGELTGPDGNNSASWLNSLTHKRVLVVSPFKDTIVTQVPRLRDVWPGLTWMEGIEYTVVSFPYLIDDKCSEPWWKVYQSIGLMVSQGNYDIALFGCGGLGLPFTKLAKDAGKVGIHLGGHLQLLFGIYGKRHLSQHWHRQHINSAWLRPAASEVPLSADRVEGSCYW